MRRRFAAVSKHTIPTAECSRRFLIGYFSSRQDVRFSIEDNTDVQVNNKYAESGSAPANVTDGACWSTAEARRKQT